MDDQARNTEQWLKDLPVTAETPGFAPDEMIGCEKCSRKNPPTRLSCFYCGEKLDAAGTRAEAISPNLRPMEAWEKGYNIILKPGGTVSEENIRAAAVLLKREPAELKSVLGKAQA